MFKTREEKLFTFKRISYIIINVRTIQINLLRRVIIMTNELFEQDNNEVTDIKEARTYATLEKIVSGAPDGTTYTKEEVLAAITNIKNNKGKNRGVLAGIAVSDMTDEQLKIELRNANSVLYKAKKRGADAELITKHEQRVEAAKAEIASRKPAVEATEGEVTETASEGVYQEPTEEELSEL